MTTAHQSKARTKTYRLVDSELVKNSPYRDEGSGVTLDIPPFRNIPWKCTITEEVPEVNDEGIRTGETTLVEREIRYVRGARSVYIDEQIKAGIKADRKPTKQEMDDLVLKDGELIAVHPNQIAYLDKVPYNKASSAIRPPRARIIFQPYDHQEVLGKENQRAATIVDAYVTIAKMDDKMRLDFLRSVNLHNGINESLILPTLRAYIENNADAPGKVEEFYLSRTVYEKGLTEAPKSDENLILVRRAVQKGVIDLSHKPGQVCMVKDGKFKKIADLEDGEAKDERLALLIGQDEALKKIILALDTE